MKMFQQWLAEWSHQVFGDIKDAMTPKNRAFKFLEESAELVQAVGVTKEEAHKLIDYVYGRPVGTPEGEVGQVLCTLGTLCNVIGITDMEGAARAELRRCREPAMILRIRKKAKGKHPESPLPGAA